MFEITSWGGFAVTTVFLLIVLFITAKWVKRETVKEREEIKKVVKEALKEHSKEIQ